MRYREFSKLKRSIMERIDYDYVCAFTPKTTRAILSFLKGIQNKGQIEAGQMVYEAVCNEWNFRYDLGSNIKTAEQAFSLKYGIIFKTRLLQCQSMALFLHAVFNLLNMDNEIVILEKDFEGDIPGEKTGAIWWDHCCVKLHAEGKDILVDPVYMTDRGRPYEIGWDIRHQAVNPLNTNEEIIAWYLSDFAGYLGNIAERYQNPMLLAETKILLNRAFKIAPQLPSVLFNMIIICRLMREIEEAREFYEQLIAIKPVYIQKYKALCRKFPQAAEIFKV